METEKALRYGGLALIGLAGAMMLSKSAKSSPKPTPKPAPPPAPPSHQALAAWLAMRRPDVVAGLVQHRWEDVFSQYLKEAWPDFIAATAGAPWSEVEGQWLRSNAPTYWTRADIQANWFGYPAPAILASGYFGDSQGKQNVIGEYLIENGAAAILAGR